MYRAFLRLPNFKGKSRIDALIRRRFHAKVTQLADFKMWLDPLEWTQADILRNGVIEPLTIALIKRLLRPGDTYVDVGAHVGFHTLVARAAVGPEGRVIAIEPQPYNCDRILQNWRLNGFENIDLHVAVAGHKAGTVALHNQAPTDKARLSLALEGVNDLPQRFHVPMVRVCDVASNVRLLKIDAEGFEPQVIASMGNPENVIFELLPGAKLPALPGYTLTTVTGEPLGGDLPESNVWAHR